MWNPPGERETAPAHRRRIKQYELLDEIGKGGMGVVYRARDTRLDREVALKRPLPGLSDTPEHRRRFLREGRAAARLDHPHIVQVLEAFEDDGVPWLAMQYVSGPSLRRLLRQRGKLPLLTAVSHGECLASALGAAHACDVLHRDVTPNNVLLGSGGRAMLTDFGLARFVETRPDATPSLGITAPGAVIGTPQYMSPEQAMGRPLDGRSDIFSLGAVLFEMLTGRYAFVAHNASELLGAILNRETDLGAPGQGFPQDLRKIVARCLAKDPDERYPDADELAQDLQRLRRRLEYEQESASRGRVARFVRVAAAGALVLVAGFALLRWRNERADAGPPAPAGRPIQVTKTRAVESEPVLAPDGSLVAFTSDESGNLEIYVAPVEGGAPLRLTDAPASDSEPAWFPDGNELAFVSDRTGRSSIWRTGRLGGDATMLVPDATEPAVSPDGRRIGFVRPGPQGELRIAVAEVGDPTSARFVTGDGDGLWDHRAPAWSGDGQTLTYWARENLWLVPANGGRARPLTSDGEIDMDPVWSPAGDRVYFSSYRDGTLALWRVSPARGRPERLTIGTGPESHPSVSADGGRLAYATTRVARDLMLLDTASGRELSVPGFDHAWMPAIAPDGGQVVFVSERLGERLELWSQPLVDGRPAERPRRLTHHDGDASHPAFSHDGRWIAYYRILDGQRDVWILSLADGGLTRFTVDPAPDIQPAWSPDGRQLAFSSERGGRPAIWIAGVRDGRREGEPRRLTDPSLSAFAPAWSPDGATIAFVATEGEHLEVWSIPADGSAAARPLTSGAEAARVRWDAATGTLLVTGSWGEDRVSLRRVSAREPSPEGETLLELGRKGVYPMFDVTPGGETIVAFRGSSSGDIWVLEAAPGTY